MCIMNLQSDWRTGSGCLVPILLFFITVISALPASYFVNDGSTSGDVYCSAPGSTNASAGLNSGTPAVSIKQIVDSYVLTGGDVVFVDTGTYTNQTTSFTSTDEGSAGNYLVIQGSTNLAAGGTVLDRANASEHVLTISGRHIKFADMTLKGGARGAYIWSRTFARFERVIFRENAIALFASGGGDHGTVLSQCVFANNTTAVNLSADVYGYTISNSVFWANGTFLIGGSFASPRNRLLNSVVSGTTLFSSTACVLEGDYNIFCDFSAFQAGKMATLSELQQISGDHLFSTVSDPQFADPSLLDFHPKSQGGRYDLSSGTWVTDVVTSIMIDYGDPLSSQFTNEPAFNGWRVNVGVYAGTSEASRTPTNIWLSALSFNDGGVISGTGQLVWTSGNIPGSGTVTLEYTTNNGTSWLPIAGGVPVTNRVYAWDVTGLAPAAVRWRVRGEGAYGWVGDTNDFRISMNGGIVPLYLNDDSISGDVYCSAPGSDTNSGLTPDSPMLTLTNLLAHHKLKPFTTVYIDTGVYSNYTVRIDDRHAGTPSGFSAIQGSPVAGGTVFARNNSAFDVFQLVQAPYFKLSSIRVCGGSRGVYLNNSANCRIESVIAQSNQTGFFSDGQSLNNVYTRCIAANNTFGFYCDKVRSFWDYGVMWNNDGAFRISLPDFLTVSNSVIRGGTAFPQSVAANSDFNVFYNSSIGGGYNNLNELQKARDGWWWSTFGDPSFANPAALDFHPQSIMGRWNGSAWVTDAVHSVLIDLGDPNSSYANEPVPHGSNVNIGVFGDTGEASKSRTNAWLQVLNFNDGGTLNAELGDRLYWRSGNFPPGTTVRIEISRSAGAPGTWEVAETNIPVSSGFFSFANTNFGSSRTARWRLVDESNTNNLSATTLTNFTLRSGPYLYYINDSSTVGDMYCYAPGSDSNDGASPGSPKLTLKSVLDSHEIQPGDIIHIDTGVYIPGQVQIISSLDGGASNFPVTILGSTNWVSGGSLFRNHGIHVSGANYMDIRNISVTNASFGIRIQNSTGTRASLITARNCSSGLDVIGSSGVVLDQCITRNTGNGLSVSGSDVRFTRGIAWKSSTAGIVANSGRVAVSNSVVVASGPRAFCYYSATATNIAGNFNCLHAESNAVVGYVASIAREQKTLSRWAQVTGWETRSIGDNPHFADPDNGDFHPMSTGVEGRYVPGFGWYAGFDPVASPLIDAGDPNCAYSQEVFNNGGRINIGFYGNTVEASRRTTNAWIYAAAMRLGGGISGTGVLNWVAGGPATGHAVRIEFSPDGGDSWSVLTSGIPATNEVFAWDTTRTNDTPAGLWRITSLADTNVWDRTERFFSVRNAGQRIYINDESTTGDVYTTAKGAATNWVATTNMPMDSLSSALALYSFEPGDAIYLDTGYYHSPSNTRIERKHGGAADSPLLIQGSTNGAAGGTVLGRGSLHPSSSALLVQSLQGVAVSNLTLLAAHNGVAIMDSRDVSLGRITALGNSNGIYVAFSSNVVVQRAVAASNESHGFSSQSSTNVLLLQSVLWSNRQGGILLMAGDMNVTSSVIHASGQGRYVYTILSNGVMRSDYNNLRAENIAGVARVGSGIDKYLVRWQERTGNDMRSLTHDPLFANCDALDFHLLSSAGRYDPEVGGFITTDAVVSPLIDNGPPGWQYALEPSPNGARVNLGLHGNSAESSKSAAGGWLLALSMNDGGSTRGTNVLLQWAVGGAATTHLVTVEFSHDNGITWSNIASDVAASAGSVLWNSDPHGSSPFGRWRLYSQSDSTISDTNDLPFVLNNGPMTYYVNDASTEGDVYCIAEGSSSNDGRTAGSPLHSLAAVIARYDIFPGDWIVLDTGIYSENSPIRLTAAIGGVATNPVVIHGSTNEAFGGSVVSFSTNSLGFELSDVVGANFQHFKIRNAVAGVRMYRSADCSFDWVSAANGGTGFEVDVSTNIAFRNCVAQNMATNGVASLSSSNVVWRSGVLWSNSVGATVGRSRTDATVPSGDITVRDTVLGGYGAGRFLYNISSGRLEADYNGLFVTNWASIAQVSGGVFPLTYPSASLWSRDTTNDVHSVSRDPLFANAAAGNFHLRSQGGRWSGSGYVSDSQTSPLIDAGNPAAAWTDEPEPNGGRLNIGLYGNSIEASLTPTNSSMVLLSLNDGGRIDGTNTIYWIARGNATSQTVKISFSADGGKTWTVIASGIPASSGSWEWNTTLVPNTLFGLLKIESETEPGVESRTEKEFAVRNGAFSFYVNDSATSGDVYCAGIGRATNTGLAASSPKSSIQGILAAYPTAPGDVIYVDTGVYNLTNDIVISHTNAGHRSGDLKLIIQGSTNVSAGGTLLIRQPDGNAAVLIDRAACVAIKDIHIRGAYAGIQCIRAEDCLFERVASVGGNRAFDLENTLGIQFHRCVARNATEVGLRSSVSSNILWQSGVLWSNALGVELTSSTNFPNARPNAVSVSNSAIAVFGRDKYAYRVSGNLASDYNSFLLRDGAFAGMRPATPQAELFENLARWVRDTGRDANSVSRDPGFVNADAGDFHLLSPAGRYSDAVGGHVHSDTVASVLIDAGDPALVFADEPIPNGSRINIGLHGNTSQASMTPTNAVLTVISLNDGGRAEGTNWPLRWLARGAATGHTVRLEFSGDAGASWTNLAAGLPATNSVFTWDTTRHASTMLGVWKITSEHESGVSDRNEALFAVRNHPMFFYVNDADSAGDVYSTGIGHSTNLGVFPSQPKDSIQGVLDAWDIEPGDTIYVDTGVYLLGADIVLGGVDAGSTNAGGEVILLGSTNSTAGGTVLDRQGGNAAIVVTNAGIVHLKHLNIRGANTGIQLGGSEECRVEWVNVEGGVNGFSAVASRNSEFHHCSIRGASGAGLLVGSPGLKWYSGVLWSNAYGVRFDSGSLVFRDSVIGAFGTNSFAYYSPPESFAPDYNCIFLTNGAWMAYRPNFHIRWYDTLTKWRGLTGADTHSLATDPLFYDPSSGDFHLRSRGGRYARASGGYVYTDSISSPLLDAGSPDSSFAGEPAPHGGRLNIGQFGNSSEASKTPTNSSLTVVTLNDGGRVEGACGLYWIARGNVTAHTVTVQFSADGGLTWATLESDIPSTNELYVWDTRLTESTPVGLWRVVSDTEPTVVGQSENYFSVRNEPLAFYVNNLQTNGNVYTTAPGDPANLGVFPHAPKESLQDLLNTWDIEPGDTIYVDTGEYLLSEPVIVTAFDAWESTNLTDLVTGLSSNRVIIQGSTNEALGGTILSKYGSGHVLQINAPGVALRDLTVRNGGSGVRAIGAHYGLAEWLRCENNVIGFDINDSHHFALNHCLARDNQQRGLSAVASTGVVWRSGVLWSNQQYGAFLDSQSAPGGSLLVENSVIAAFGTNAFAYFKVKGNWTSDYNCVHLRNGAFAGGVVPSQNFGGSTNRYEGINLWNKTTGQDEHTLTPEEGPGFVNPDAGNFYLKTTRLEGRYDPVSGAWTNDSGFSRLIDSGRPSSAYTNEPAPNGSRIDIGLHGNTWRASKTPTNGWFNTITFNDGGRVSDTVVLHWTAGGDATNHYVRIDFSPVAGLYWTNVASFLLPSASGSYVWDTLTAGRSFAGLWRIVSHTDSNVYYISDQYFTLTTNVGGSVWYFVNDASTNGDVYCEAPGSPTNSGFSPEAPAASIAVVLRDRKLEPSDRIYVDTGYYYLNQNLVIDDLDSGTQTDPVYIIGSTNRGMGGTVLDRQIRGNGTRGIVLDTARSVILQNLTVKNAEVGVHVSGSEHCQFDDVVSEDNSSAGFSLLNKSAAIRFNRCIARNNHADGTGYALINSDSQLEWNSGVMWDNPSCVSFVRSGASSFRNSAFQASGLGQRVYLFDQLSSPGSVASDYNNFIYLSGATLAENQYGGAGGNDLFGSLYDWQQGYAKDLYSLSHEPLFADSLNGDFRLKSVRGRFLDNGTLTNDAVHSPMIDTGDPSSDYSLEPAPAGSRINMGSSGNTTMASLSRTNAWLLAISFNDGPTIRGTNTLLWASGGMSNGALVKLEFSANNGIEWETIASNVLDTTTGYSWDVSQKMVSRDCLWRVVWQDDASVADVVDRPFVIKNEVLNIYINDTNTVGDVFCTAPGHSSNSGLTNSAPLNDPALALQRFPIGAGDTIFIDTGVYNITNNMVLGELNRGVSGMLVRVVGSTNAAAGGTWIRRQNAAGIGLHVRDTRYIEVSDLKLSGAGRGLLVQSSYDCTFRSIQAFSNSISGFVFNDAPNSILEHCAAWSNPGWGLQVAGGSVQWQSGVLWSNLLGGADVSGGTLDIQNSIVHSPNSDSFLYQVGAATINGDYNVYWRESNAGLVRDSFYGFVLKNNLSEWQRLRNTDWHSALLNPRFADARGGDFHLLSKAGRFSWAETNWVTDAVTSWAIDAGNPSSAFSQEPAPNGGRLNAGLFGNAQEASKSLTNLADRALLTVSLNDGGLASGVVGLVWLSRGMTSSDSVSLWYSPDGGATWNLISSNVPARQSEYVWDASSVESTPLARWKVELQSEPGINDTSDKPFVLRNSPITYYVNDGSLVGDVYTTAIGASTNLGYYPHSPKASIQEILDEYDVDGSDTVFVDTGWYPLDDKIFIDPTDGGVNTARVSIVGSTNVTAGGTRIKAAPGQPVFHLKGASYVSLANFIISNANNAVFFEQNANNNSVQDFLILDGITGITLSQSGNNEIRQTVIARMSGNGVRTSGSSGNLLDGCIVWSNGTHAISMVGSSISISNSVLHAYGPGSMCYHDQTNATVSANYNNLFVHDGAFIGNVAGVPLVALPQWNMASGNDLHSLSVDPLFHDHANNDFHLMSEWGRYNPASGSFISDTNTSMLIDAGAPAAACAAEPEPNGNRRNIGRYGNTGEASKSPTNSWVRALTANSGGRLEGTFYLTWNAVNVASTNRVVVEYSPDNGGSWMTVAHGIPVDAYWYLWNSAQKDLHGEEVFWSSPLARWRVSLVSDPGVCDTTDQHFALRNRPFSYFVNDAYTAGDVYCTAAGSDTNLGIFAYIPKATLKSLFDEHDIVGGDSVYVDTGTYLFSTNEYATLGLQHQGSPGSPVLLRGNTNAPLTVFDRMSVGPGATILSLDGSYVDVSDIVFRGGSLAGSGNDISLSGLIFTNGSIALSGFGARLSDSTIWGGNVTASAVATNTTFERVTIRNGGMSVLAADSMVANCVIAGNANPALSIDGEFIHVRNNTFVGTGTQIRQGDGYALLQNNIIIASGAERFCIQRQTGTMASDYNNLLARNGAWIGNHEGNWERLHYWQRMSGQDLNSISLEPLFADEAGGDYHLRSIEGRYTSTGWLSDAVHSPCIDAGTTGLGYGNEPTPNGERVNMGAYGNTEQASKSRTNAWLQVATMNDGGVLKGTQTLRWLSGNLDPTNRLRLEYSSNNGVSWVVIAAGLEADSNQFLWDTAAFDSSLAAQWRVVLESDPTVQSQTANSFAVRNSPLNFYVNDSSTNNDVYTTAAGSAGNDGLTPSTPKNSIQGVLDSYDTEANDVVYVDTGSYVLPANTRVIWSRGGDQTGHMRLQGSTNYVAGGTILNRNSFAGNSYALDIPASYVAVRDLTIQRAGRGLNFDSNMFCLAEGIVAVSNMYGIVNTRTIALTNRNIRFWNNQIGGIDVVNSRTTVVENCAFVGQSNFGYRVSGSVADTLQNNIFYLNESNSTALAGSSNNLASAFIDYNVYYFGDTSTAIYAEHRDLTRWQLDEGHDFRSAVTNPLFADLEAADFHLKSEAGRYSEVLGWVTDSETSWAIDKGNPYGDFSREPEIHGNRANIGAYGNTPHASKGSTNVFVYARVLNEPTMISQTNFRWALIWTGLNLPTGQTVSVQFSGDGGTNWVNLAAGLDPYQEYIIWDTTSYYNTHKGRWRVVLDPASGIWDMNDEPFDIFYGRFEIRQISVNSSMNRILWRGAWDETYQVQYTTNILGDPAWLNAPTGGLSDQVPFFRSTRGGDFIYEDVDSLVNPFRMYRVVRSDVPVPVFDDMDIGLLGVFRQNMLNNILWECNGPGNFSVEVSTNACDWNIATSGVGTNQQAVRSVSEAGIFTFEDIDSVSPAWRMYRIRYNP